MKKIKVTPLSEPTRKSLSLNCPNCNTRMSREVPIDDKSGTTTCNLCGTSFRWEEVEE